MTNVIKYVEDYEVVADNGFQFNVFVRAYNNMGNRKWMIEKVGLIRDYFTFTDGADRGLIIDVFVYTHEITVTAEFNGKKYWAYPIRPKFGKKQIREMLSNMGVVADVMAVYTNNMVDMVNNDMEENNMNDMTGIDENGFSIEGLAYVNENMRVVDVDMIKDCIEECVEDSYVMDRVFGWQRERRVDFEEFCDVLWTNYVWDRVLDSGCTDESLENETRYVMEFNDRVRYIVEHNFDMLYVNCYDEIGVDDMVKNDSPCLDDVDIELANDRLADWLVERAKGSMGDYFTDVTKNMWDYSRDDINEDRVKEILFEKVDGLVDVEFTEPDDDRNIVRIWFDRPIKKKRQDSVKVAKVIKDYVDNYEGMLMDYNGYGASICVPWDVFNEDDMKMLIEDDEFEAYVGQYLMKTNIYDMLVYDDGVYVSVDVEMFDRVA